LDSRDSQRRLKGHSEFVAEVMVLAKAPALASVR